MSATPQNNPQSDVTTTTLGDLLYADKTKSRVSEEEWVGMIRAIARGDQFALHELYERAHRIAFTLIMRITNNRETAEELTLDVFHDVWRRAPQYAPTENGSVLAWIMNQARSRAIDRVRFETRRKRVNPYPEHPDQESAASDPAEALELLQQQGQLLPDTLAVLTTEERQAIETAFFAELTYAEAATRLEQPLGTIKTRIRSALGKLRQAFAAQVKKP